MIIVIIFPLILDNLDNPFELAKCSKFINKNMKKNHLSVIIKERFIDIDVLRNYKWKYIELLSCSLQDEEFEYISERSRSSFALEHFISDYGLKYIPNIRKL